MTSLFVLVSLRRLLAAVYNGRAQSQVLIDRGRPKRWMGENKSTFLETLLNRLDCTDRGYSRL